jgi:putative phage-type endonuclease
MIILNVEQNSPEWFEARCGIPTASSFKEIITSTGKASTSASNYMNKLLAEWVTGNKTETKQSEWMERGVLLEQEARDFYEFQTDKKVKQVGLVYRDETKMVACSPDGLLDNSGLEIKCPAPHTHIKYLLSGKLPAEYVPQVQGSIWVTGADSWDFISYHPDIDPMLIHVERDDEYIEKLESEVNKFVSKLIKQRERLIEIGAAA